MLMLLMQEYVYKFNYDQEDGISMDIARNGKTVDRTKKRQVCASPCCMQIDKVIGWLLQISRLVLVIAMLNARPSVLAVDAESQCELCQVSGVPADQDAGAHLQDT